MATKVFKYGHLWSKTSGATPNVSDMIPGEIALNLFSGDTHIWSTDGEELIDLTSKIGGDGDDLSVHAELVNGNKEFSSLVWIKEVTNEETLPANVQRRYRLVNAASGNVVTSAITADDGTVILPGNESEYIDIYKDSSIVEIYVGTEWDSLTNDNELPVIKKQVGDTDIPASAITPTHSAVTESDLHYLNYVYYAGGFSGETSGDSKYYMTQIDINQILSDAKFASGVTANENGIITGVVDSSQDLLVTEWTAGDATNAGTSAATESGLTVGESGFSLVHVQEAINARHANTIIMSGYTSGVTEDVFGITSADTVMQAIKKIEDKLYSNGDGKNQSKAADVDNNTGIVFVEGSDTDIILKAGTF